MNVFAPFTVNLNRDNSPIIQKTVAEAAGGYVTVTKVKRDSTSITFNITITRDKTDNHSAVFVFADKNGTTESSIVLAGNTFKDLTPPANTTKPPHKQTFNPANGKETTNGSTPQGWVQNEFEFTETGLTSSTEYWVSASLQNGTSEGGYTSSLNTKISTLAPGETDNTAQVISRSDTEDGFMPSCGLGNTWFTNGTIMGCVAQIVYYVFFQSTSFLFGLAGTFFDNTFAYSVNSSSYDTGFVLEGWGVVRDFCNIFFIFVLLYIAFSTILNLHGFKTKEMVIHVVIIGLLINFSLFAAHVVIDTSNILARVFYNSDVIKLKDNKGGAIALEEGKPIPLSAAIVAKVEPQRLIIDGTTKVSVVDKVTGKESKAGTGSGIGTGTFILITLLAVAVNIVGMIVFLSVGLIFVARVIGLWMYMIFAPFAFFSYTVPSMQGLDMVGWKKWWPELLSLSFLAPIFIFFLYLILKFLNVMSIVKTDGSGSIGFVISIIVPFAFIMILLTKAKSIAKKMSGELGQSITGAVTAVGGLALGGAALGAAFAGRNILGRGVAAASRTEGAQHYGREKVAFNKKLDDWERNGKKGAKPTWEAHAKANNVKTDWRTRLGGNLNAKQAKVNEVDHARHEMDSVKEKAGLKGVENFQLSGVDKEKMKTTFAKEKKGEIEADIRKGDPKAPLVDANGQTVKDNKGQVITGGESGFKAAKRDEVSHEVGIADPNNVDHKTGELTEAAKKKVEDELNVQFNAVLKTSTDHASAEKFSHLEQESKQKVSGVDRVFARSNKGSYDARNLSQTKVADQAHWTGKMTAGLIAGIAMGVRTGLKGTGVKHGSGQNDFLKDIGHTITEALESAKVKVKVEESHGKSADDHGGGGAHH